MTTIDSNLLNINPIPFLAIHSISQRSLWMHIYLGRDPGVWDRTKHQLRTKFSQKTKIHIHKSWLTTTLSRVFHLVI